jgi:predicted RNase H-like HicB family nuclease
MNKFRYSVKLVWSVEDDGYIATSDEFPHMSGWGKSAGVALLNLQEAVWAACQIMREDGDQLPEPIMLSKV